MTAHGTTRLVALLAAFAALPAPAWEVRPAAKDPLGGPVRCLLAEGPVTVHDGYGDTRIDILFTGEALVLVTDSEIDASFNDLALSVAIEARRPVRGQPKPEPPPSPHFVPERIADRKTVVFKEAAAIEEAFRAGSTATFALRFWPIWPSVGSIPVEVSLKGFSKVADEFARCAGQPTASTTTR